MNTAKRLLARVTILLLNISVWYIILFVVLHRSNARFNIVFALAVTYFVAAYLLLPLMIRIASKLWGHHHLRRYTLSADGWPTDPVNVVVTGSQQQLEAAFTIAKWNVADPLSARSSLNMVLSFLLNKPYPTAPFSSLYLFGRKQDIGFQKDIDNSPRKRHHIRFWAADADQSTDITDPDFWLQRPHIDPHQTMAWIGAGSKDTGFGLTRKTFQISHAVDKDINAERDFIVNTLKETGLVKQTRTINAGEIFQEQGMINQFVTDGRVVVLRLVDVS